MLHLIEEDQKWWSENKKEGLMAAFVQRLNCLIPVISEASLDFFQAWEKKV